MCVHMLVVVASRELNFVTLYVYVCVCVCSGNYNTLHAFFNE